jgi:hypothetical protein
LRNVCWGCIFSQAKQELGASSFPARNELHNDCPFYLAEKLGTSSLISLIKIRPQKQLFSGFVKFCSACLNSEAPFCVCRGVERNCEFCVLAMKTNKRAIKYDNVWENMISYEKLCPGMRMYKVMFSIAWSITFSKKMNNPIHFLFHLFIAGVRFFKFTACSTTQLKTTYVWPFLTASRPRQP